MFTEHSRTGRWNSRWNMESHFHPSKPNVACPERGPQKGPAVPADPSRAQASILIVDDTAENLIAFRSALSALGQDIISVRSGREALHSLLRQDFAVILLDVNMPEMDGFETATLIRQRRTSAHTPIIFVSATSTTETKAFQGYCLGAVDYLCSPVIPEVLRSKVGVFVDLYRQGQEIHRLNVALTNRAAELEAANTELQGAIKVRTRTEEVLKETNAELEAFAYTVSHDLRAPLRAMQGFAQALLEDRRPHLDSTGCEYAQRIVSAAVRLDALIQDLLLYSRISHGPLKLARVDIGQVISDALAHLEVSSQPGWARIVRHEPLYAVRGHRTTLVQIVGNLLSNALKFVAPGVRAEVRLRMERRAEWARLWVEDNGIGIPPESQARIFRVFERLHGVEAYPGTGVGLAIVRKGVERMGGRVGVESRPAQGSRFWIELPLAMDVSENLAEPEVAISGVGS
jgi:signal transduction histidine kinase